MDTQKVQLIHARKGWYWIHPIKTVGSDKHPLWIGPFPYENTARESARLERFETKQAEK